MTRQNANRRTTLDSTGLLQQVNLILRNEGVDPVSSLNEALDRLSEIDVNLESRAERARSMASQVRTRLDAIEFGDED
jgi:regulator of PEP synthase PpsR (kinase-PPPase family)